MERWFDWGRGRWLLGARTYIMAVLNVTPDSFSDGGRFNREDTAIAQAEALWAAGADAIDVGGESTRPDFTPVSVETEWERVGPILRALRRRGEGCLSVDTQKPEIARRALDEGVDVINDIWGFRRDSGMLKVLSASRAGAVMMFNQEPGFSEGNVFIPGIVAFFTQQLQAAQSQGVSTDRILVDPGLGFAYGVEENWTVLRHLAAFADLGAGLLLGPSRKRFLGAVTSEPAAKRDIATAAVAALAVSAGLDVARVHAVDVVRPALAVADRWVRSG